MRTLLILWTFFLLIFTPSVPHAEDISVDQVREYVKYTYGLTDISAEMLDSVLVKRPEFMDGTYLGVFEWAMAIEESISLIYKKDYIALVDFVSKKIISIQLANTFIGKTILSAYNFGNLAALPIGWSLNKFIEGANKDHANNHFKIYFAARKAGYNHENIINQQYRDDLAVINYENGWITHLEDYVNNTWQSAAPTDTTPQQLYEKAQLIYDAIDDSGQFYADMQTIGDEFKKLIFPQIVYAPVSPIAPSDIAFNVTGQLIDGRNISSWNWTFGDGETSSQASPTHYYRVPGNYSVTVTFIDDTGQTHQLSTTVTVLRPPITVEYPNGYESLERRFSTPANTEYTSYSWDFGDGTIRTDEGNTPSPYIFATSGYYTIRLTVTLNDNT